MAGNWATAASIQWGGPGPPTLFPNGNSATCWTNKAALAWATVFILPGTQWRGGGLPWSSFRRAVIFILKAHLSLRGVGRERCSSCPDLGPSPGMGCSAPRLTVPCFRGLSPLCVPCEEMAMDTLVRSELPLHLPWLCWAPQWRAARERT